MNDFERRLKGGHPNSLGDTVAVVEEVLNDRDRFGELFACYFSDDEVVRLRTSNAMKRIGQADKSLLLPYADRFLTEIADLDQASAQWTLAQLFDLLSEDLSDAQRARAKEIMQRNLAYHQDWIVLNQTMTTLAKWATADSDLRVWLTPHLARLRADERKSVSGRAAKATEQLARQGK